MVATIGLWLAIAPAAAAVARAANGKKRAVRGWRKRQHLAAASERTAA